MPLAFESINHGAIAFGFFNIDCDMLLLEQYFLFASEFCQHICDLAEKLRKGSSEFSWPVYVIEDRAQIGDLMGAIHGVHYSGFIGQLYKRFPFPEEPEEFRQKPEGYQNQVAVRNMISAYAGQSHIPVSINDRAMEIEIGEYTFSREIFHEMIKYVWRGGLPRWKQEIRPPYVEAMKTKIEMHAAGLFAGVQFE